MGKGSNTTSSSSTSSADPQAAQLYRDILQRAQGVASTPYQAYTGELTAGVNSQQQAGIGNINANANFASPYIQQAAGQAQTSSAPIDAATIAQYQNPYTQQVIDATMAQMQHDNATAMTQLQGNQIAQGALGGNATGVAKGILAGQQGRTAASTTADLYNKAYTQALGAAQQQQQTGLAGANALANYGISGQNAALAGANAQIGAGTLQQTTEQQRLNALYQQYQQQQAYPYQQAQWLAGIGTGVGSNLGGTSSGTTTAPAPNQTGQLLGAGLSAASMFLSDRDAKEDIQKIGTTNDGQNIYRYRYKGSPQYHIGLIAQEVKEDHPESVARGAGGLHYVDLKGATDDAVSRASGGGVGGTPWDGAQGWIPTMQIHGGSGAPHASAPSAPSNQGVSGADYSKIASGMVGVGKGLQGLDWGGAYSAGFGNLSGDSWGGGSFMRGDQFGGSSESPLAGLSPEDYGVGFAAGGGVMGYAPSDGAVNDDTMDWLRRVPAPAADTGPTFQDRWSDRVAPRREAPIANFKERAQPTKDAIASGTFDEQGGYSTDFQGTPGMQAANTGVVPVPRGRPDGAPVAPGDPDDGEEDTPATGLAGAGRGAGVPVMAFGPEGSPGGYRGLPDAIRRPSGEEPGFGLGLLSRNAQTGLLAAGLGMLASRSPNLGNVVGEGGLAGLSTYGAANEADRKAAIEAEKLSREAQNTAFSQQMSVRKQNEAERHSRVTEDTAIKNLDREKWVPAGQYMGEDGVYRPVVMSSTTGDMKDPITGKKIGPDAKVVGKNDTGFSDEEAKAIARRFVVSGDITDMQGIGPAARLKVTRAIREVQKDLNVSDEELAQRKVEFAGRKAGSRTLSQMEAKMGSAAIEAEGAIKLVRGVIERLPRTSFMPFNRLIEGYQKNTLNPDQAELYARAQAIVNTYSAVMSRGANVTTDSSRHHAAELLNTAGNADTFNRVLDTMLNEIEMAKHAPAKMQEFYRHLYGPKSVEQGNGSAGGPGAVPAAPTAKRVIQNGITYERQPDGSYKPVQP